MKELKEVNQSSGLLKNTMDSNENENENKPVKFQYKRQIEYWLIMVGYAIGYGSFWRFPYLVYSCGGGVFLIPFFFFLIFLGIPMFSLEAIYGQIFRKGPVEVFKTVRNKFEGLGWAAVLVSWFISIYYALILVWSYYYMYLSFFSPLPWIKSTDNFEDSTDFLNSDFFEKSVLNKSDSIDFMGEINVPLFWALLVTYISIYLCIYNGIGTSSKVVYVTAPAPIILLIILLIKGFQLKGFEIGLKYFFIPNFEKLLDIDVWLKACNQVVFMIGLGQGGNILFAKYRNPKDDLYTSSYAIPLMTAGCGMLCGIINFCYLGHVSFTKNIPLEQLPLKGIDLAFITYPSAIALLPYPNVWAVIFFFMMVTLGIDSQFAFIETVSHYAHDYFLIKYMSKKYSTLLFCAIGTLFGVPLIMQGGFYLFELIDSVCTLVALFLVLFLESFISFRYIGLNNIQELIANKTNRTLPNYVFFSLKFLSPVTFFILLFLSIWQKLSEKGKYKSIWPYFVEWLIILLPVAIIIYYFVRSFRIDKSKSENLIKNQETSI